MRVLDCNSSAETTTEHTPNDLMGLLLKDFDRDSGYLQVVATREDFVPQYTPADADSIVDAIRERFIDEVALR